MESILFLILKSPFKCEGMEPMDLLGAGKRRGVLLVEDGVYFATHDGSRKELVENNVEIFVINDDLAARGYADFSNDNVTVIDYPGAVDVIMEKYDTVLTV